jgi:glycosyltransferase involved in cell wall biosynthesis
MGQAPKVSVVIPAYNHERFIGEAIDSVLSQSFHDLELIVVDDGSTDASAEIARQRARADSRVRVIEQANAGSLAAIERGLNAARGSWLALLNSDDRWALNRLERLMQLTHEGAQWITTGVRLIDDQGLVNTDPAHWWHRTQSDFRAKARQFGPAQGLLYGNYTVSTSNFFFSRELHQRVGLPKRLRMVPDWAWALEVALTAPQAMRFVADEALLDYRLHGHNTILGNLLRGNLEVLHMHRRVLAAVGTPGPLISAVLRNLRDLRRHWRDLGVAKAEGFVRDREADLAALAQAHGQLQAQLKTVYHQRDQLQETLAEQTRQAQQWAQEFDRAVELIRQREADVQTLQQQAAEAERLAHRQAAAVHAIQAQVVQAERFVREREADVAALQAQAQQAEHFVREREADVAALQAQLAQAQQLGAQQLAELNRRQSLLDEAESSWTWRHLRSLRRRWGWTRL